MTETCKKCGDSIDGHVFNLNGSFPMHGECYQNVIEAGADQ